MTKDELLQSLDNGKPNAEQAGQLLDMAMGDTDFWSDNGAPDAVAETDKDAATDDQVGDEEGDGKATEAAGKTEIELNAENSVVLARDGKHTIPYDTLVKHREAEQHWKAEAEAREQALIEKAQEMEALREQLEQRQADGKQVTQAQVRELTQQAVDAGLDPEEVFGDWSGPDMLKAVERIARQSQADLRKELAELRAVVEPSLAQQQAQAKASADTAHWSAIEARHPDVASIAESQELQAWIDAKPSFMRDALNAVIDRGNATQVVEMLDAFKADTGVAAAAPDAKARAQQIAQSTKPKPPATLSDIPGGRPAATNSFEVAASLSPLDLSQTMESWSPEQIEAFLNRTM